MKDSFASAKFLRHVYSAVPNKYTAIALLPCCYEFGPIHNGTDNAMRDMSLKPMQKQYHYICIIHLHMHNSFTYAQFIYICTIHLHI